MNMNRLLQFGIPPEVIEIWKKSESDSLLPVQAMAVNQYALFEAENLLIQAPTSSGKTFIGEMAAIHTALRMKKVVYLVPLKALAEEKYLNFKKKYESYGLKVIISTRDHRHFDSDLEEGNFSIAFVVYEKLSQLLIRRPERIAELKLVVADELELLSDPERGAGVELLLTRLVQSDCRIIGLSAVIGYAERLATWMNAKLLRYERRPVELRFGVLHEGSFRYRTYNDFTESEERFGDADMGEDSMWGMLSATVTTLASRGESCLIFVKAKHEARHGATMLANIVSEQADEQSIDSLKKLEATSAREILIDTLSSGVAFHSADLMPEERRIVEQGFRGRRFKILVSTSTLAVGLNMPSCNVFIATDKWCYEKNFGMPWKAPILRSEYENMGGRAGRLGTGLPFGRSIILAPSAYDAETLWRRYVEGEREAIQPRLCTESLQDAMLSLVSSSECQTEEALRVFFDQTISGQWVWQEQYTEEEIEQQMRTALCQTIDAGMLTRDEETNRLRATPMGIAVASKGIALSTARAIETWIMNSQYREWDDLDALVAFSLTEDGRTYGVSLYSWEFDQQIYFNEIREHMSDYAHLNDVPLSQICNDISHIYFEDVRGLKVALMMQAWIGGDSMLHIEERYHTMAGQILMAVRQLAWLIDAAAAIATAVGATRDCLERLNQLAFRVVNGVSRDAFPLASIVGPDTSRQALTALAAQGLHTPQALVDVSAGVLEAWMSKEEAKTLRTNAFRVVGKQQNPDATENAGLEKKMNRERLVLTVDPARPDQIRLAGNRVPLQDKQFRLISLLAENVGSCVSYDQIYDDLWGAIIVEQNQIHFQKRKLKKAIIKYAPEFESIITTVPKRGFLLDLSPDQVEVIGSTGTERQLVLGEQESTQELVNSI